MAGQLTENEIFNFCDYSAGYISLVLGRCALISLAVFGLALLLRGGGVFEGMLLPAGDGVGPSFGRAVFGEAAGTL